MTDREQRVSLTAQRGLPILGKYRAIAKLGQGGMADVYLAAAPAPGSVTKLVVIKRHRDTISNVERNILMFLDEAKLSGRLHHPNIVQTYEVDIENGSYFIVMEYLEGQALDLIVGAVASRESGSEGFTRGVWVRIVADMLSGLHYAHELRDYDGTPLGIVHRDVSPQNVFVTYDGVVKIVDFGIAKAALNTTHTDTGVLKGKVSYMSPEQVEGSKPINRRSDIFAGGIILWELLAQRRLFDGTNLHVFRQLMGSDDFPRLATVVPDIPPALDDIVAKALERDPGKRFATAQEMRAALDGYLRSSGEDIRAEEIGERMQRTFETHRANIRREIKRCLDRTSSPPNEADESRPSWRSGSGSARGSRRGQETPVNGPEDELATLRATRARAFPLKGGYVVAGLCLLAVAGGGAVFMRTAGDLARSAPVSSAPSAPSAPTMPQCKGTLRVRITTDNIGATSDVAPSYNHGIYDYFRYLDDTRGGLRGCRIDVDMQDARYEVDRTRAVVEAWRQKPEWPEVSTVFIHGTGPTAAVAGELTKEKKLIIPGSYAGSFATPDPISVNVPYPEINSTGEQLMSSDHKTSPGYPYVFFPATDYSTAIRIGIRAAWKVAPGRMAMAHADQYNCLFCVEPLTAGKAYIQQVPGMRLGPDLIVPQTSNRTDGPKIIRLVMDYVRAEIQKKLSDPTYVPVSWFWSGNTVISSAFVGKGAAEAQKLINSTFKGPKDRWRLRVMANNWAIGEESIEVCGSDCAGVLYGLFPVPLYGDIQHSTGMQRMLAIHDMSRAKDGEPLNKYKDIRYVQGYTAALMWHKAAELAIDAGHTTPTGEDLKNALESFRNVELDGMTAGPVSFSPSDHRPQMNEAVYMIATVNDQSVLKYVDQYSIERKSEWLGY
jgi:serine/threonine protein kinase